MCSGSCHLRCLLILCDSGLLSVRPIISITAATFILGIISVIVIDKASLTTRAISNLFGCLGSSTWFLHIGTATTNL